MFQHVVYKCPKCSNTLLVSNKMLHDLRCTEENPATYENVLFRESQNIANLTSKRNYFTNNEPKKPEKVNIINEDGTTIDIKKRKNMSGRDEFVETKYDKEGNILSRKKAANSNYRGTLSTFQELSDYNQYDVNDFDTNYDNNNNTYYEMNTEVKVRNAPPSIIYETAAPQEIVYTAPAKYHPTVTINKPIEETIISSDTTIPDAALNDIIRQTMHLNNNNTTTSYNIQNDINLNNYTQKSTTGTTNYNQSNYTNNSNQINYGNITNYSNQFNYNNQITSGSNSVYSNSYQTNGNYINKGSGDVLKKTAGMGSIDYTSYDYKY